MPSWPEGPSWAEGIGAADGLLQTLAALLSWRGPLLWLLALALVCWAARGMTITLGRCKYRGPMLTEMQTQTITRTDSEASPAPRQSP